MTFQILIVFSDLIPTKRVATKIRDPKPKKKIKVPKSVKKILKIAKMRMANRHLQKTRQAKAKRTKLKQMSSKAAKVVRRKVKQKRSKAEAKITFPYFLLMVLTPKG